MWRVVDVETAAELRAACEERFDACDVLLMAAAVADFRPVAPAATKLKKDTGPPGPIELEVTDDVLSGLAARRRPGQRLVGFAAEHGEGAVAYGRDKLERKRLDVVVVNDISRSDIGFDVDQNEVVIVSTRGERPVPRASKQRIAAEVLDEVERLPSEREVADGTGRADAGRVARV